MSVSLIGDLLRAVTHLDVSRQEVETAVAIARDLLRA